MGPLKRPRRDDHAPRSAPHGWRGVRRTAGLRAWVVVLRKEGAEWQRRIGRLQLVIGDEPAAYWTMALLPGQDVASLDEDSYFGYGVDAGTGTLADQVAIEALNTWDFDRIDDVFIPARIPDDPIEAVISAVVDEGPARTSTSSHPAGATAPTPPTLAGPQTEPLPAS